VGCGVKGSREGKTCNDDIEHIKDLGSRFDYYGVETRIFNVHLRRSNDSCFVPVTALEAELGI
jgi:hypothetical protein